MTMGPDENSQPVPHAGGLRHGQDARATEAAAIAREAQALREAGRHAEARLRWAAALRLAPNTPEYDFGLATAAWAEGQVDLVEPHLLHAIRLNPRYVQAHVTLAEWYLDQGLIPQAL